MRYDFKKIYSRLTKDSKTEPEIISSIMLWPDGSIPTPEKYEDYTKLYATVLWVYACIWAIASHGSMVPYHIFEVSESEEDPDEADKKEVNYSHPARKFFRNPNPVNTFEDIIESLLTYLELNGDVYLEKVLNGMKNQLVEMYTLRPDRMKVYPRKDGRGIDHYRYKVKRWRKGVSFKPEEISHLKYFNPNNDWYGQSTLLAATNTILLEQYATQFQVNNLKNNAIPQGVLETDYDADDDEMRRIKKAWLQNYQGVTKVGGIAVLPLGLKFKPLSYHPRDLEWKNLLANNKERIFAITGVNNAVLGILENMTYDNYRMQIRSFFMNVMKPKMQKISARFTKDILPAFGENLVFEFDFSPFLAEDESELSTRLQREIQYAITNPNEAREQLNKKRYDGGDTFFIATNLQPIGSVDSEFNEEEQPVDNEEPNVDENEEIVVDNKSDDVIEPAEIERRNKQDRERDIQRGVTATEEM